MNIVGYKKRLLMLGFPSFFQGGVRGGFKKSAFPFFDKQEK
jgi:hypothetical protein